MLQDNYEHSDESVLYTPVNIPGPGMDLSMFDEQFEGCDCLWIRRVREAPAGAWRPGRLVIGHTYILVLTLHYHIQK